MKRSLIIFLLPLFCTAQGVRLNQFDVFEKKQRIEMESVPMLSTSAAKMTVTFSAVGADLFVQFAGAGWGALTVDDGNEFIFRLANDSTVAVKADGLQTFEPGIPQSSYRHRYRLTQNDVEMLAQNEIAGLRKFSFKEAVDLRLPKEAGTKLQRPGLAFLAELKKATVAVPLKRIHAKDVLEHIGDSVQFCSLVYNVSHNGGAEKATMVNLQADYKEPVVNLWIADDDRANITADADAAFINKEVCVSGVLWLRNNVPTITVRKKEQVALKPAANK